MKAHFITIFPELFGGPLATGPIRIAREKGLPKPDPDRLASLRQALADATIERRAWMQRLFERLPDLARWRGPRGTHGSSREVALWLGGSTWNMSTHCGTVTGRRNGFKVSFEPVGAFLSCIVLAGIGALFLFEGKALYDRAAGTLPPQQMLDRGARLGRAEDVRTALLRGASVNSEELGSFTPLFIFALSESARPRRASLSRSATLRRASFTPATSIESSAAAAEPPPMATFVLSCVTSRPRRFASPCRRRPCAARRHSSRR